MDNGTGGSLACRYCLESARLRGKVKAYPQVAHVRGVCYECHKRLRRLVVMGQATDAELVIQGHWLPAKDNPWRRRVGVKG